MTRRVFTGTDWEPVVGYSRAVAAGDYVFVASSPRSWARSSSTNMMRTRRPRRRCGTWRPPLGSWAWVSPMW